MRQVRTVCAGIALSLALNAVIGGAQQVCSAAPKGSWKSLHRVVVLRPRVKITKMGAFASSDSEGAAEEVETAFQGVLSRTFENQGFTAFLDPSLMPEWEEKNTAALNALKDSYDTLSPGACKAVLTISFTSDLEKLVDNDQFDAVVLSRANGSVIDKSSKMATLTNLKTDTSLHFSLAVVDMKSGRIVHYCYSWAYGDYIGAAASSLSEPIQKCLQNYARH